jgi:hypothetical protein
MFLWTQNAGGLALKQRNDVAPHVGSASLRGDTYWQEGVWVQLSSGFSCKVSAIESWLSIVEPQPRMGFSQISETTEKIQLIRVPEPASQVPLSVVSDIFDENVGFTSALFAYPRKKSLKQAWLCIRFARHFR